MGSYRMCYVWADDDESSETECVHIEWVTPRLTMMNAVKQSGLCLGSR